jgi:hypothetical protein
MDGVTKQLADYFERLEKTGDLAVEAIKEQIDIEAGRTESEIRAGTPTDTGGLARSFTASKIDTPKKYGYRLEYEGTAPNGEPYAKIANILDSGTSTIKPRRFIIKAVKKLKGLDERAALRFEEKTKEIGE